MRQCDSSFQIKCIPIECSNNMYLPNKYHGNLIFVDFGQANQANWKTKRKMVSNVPAFFAQYVVSRVHLHGMLNEGERDEYL